MEAPGPPPIRIDAVDPDTAVLWRTVAEVARALADQRAPWCLVGGLMVALFAIEAGQLQRPTTDIDILSDARARPSGTDTVTDALGEIGGTLMGVDGLEFERGFRFDVGGQVVDVLAPDGLGKAAHTMPPLQTIQIPGGTQALRRTELVEIVVDGAHAVVRRPTLLGAILLKARSLRVHRRPDDQREDLVMLLGLMTDPRAARETMTATEARWLRDIDGRLALDDADLEATYDAAHLRVARAAYRLLTAA